MYDRFDNEQLLLECWNIVEHIRTLNEAVLETDMSRDKISNVLMGLADLYDYKFDRLFNMFEQSVKESYESRKSNSVPAASEGSV